MYDSIETSCDNRGFQTVNFSIGNIIILCGEYRCNKVTNVLIFFILMPEP